MCFSRGLCALGVVCVPALYIRRGQFAVEDVRQVHCLDMCVRLTYR